jgi:hypothetical protein
VNDRSSALFGAKNNLVLLIIITFLFFSVLAPTQGVVSAAQRRAFGGDSFFSLSPPNDKISRSCKRSAELSCYPKCCRVLFLVSRFALDCSDEIVVVCNAKPNDD